MPRPRKHNIEYVLPAKEVTVGFVKAVCQELRSRTSDKAYVSKDFQQGLMTFIHLAQQIQIKHLNYQSQFKRR